MEGTRTANVIMAIVIGDALGSATEGMGKGHVAAHFKDMDGYREASQALKGKMERWKKPGLYTSLSQVMLLSLMGHHGKGFNRNEFIACLSGAGDLERIFRGPGTAEKAFFQRIRDNDRSPAPEITCCRIVPAVLPLSILAGNSSATLDLCTCFTTAPSVITGSLILAETARLIAGGADNYRQAGLLAASSVKTDVEKAPEVFFRYRLNPDRIGESVAGYREVLAAIQEIRSIGEAEKKICVEVNRTLKTPITRATVNLPLALLPYALTLNDLMREDEYLLYKTAHEGGASAPLCAITGSLASARGFSGHIREELLAGLVNRKRILSMSMTVPDTSSPEDFLTAEAQLTAKETEERNARLKHIRQKPAGKKARKDPVEALNRHVVESWTKIDRARWKKERKRSEKDESDR